MRYFQLALLCFICVAQSYSQTGTRSYHTIDVKITKEKKPKRIYTKVEMTPPALIGGDSSWVQSLEERLNRTISVKRKVKPGTYIVSVRLLIERDGSLADLRCISDPGFALCEQVVEVLKRFVRWQPSSYSKVRQYHTTSVTPQVSN